MGLLCLVDVLMDVVRKVPVNISLLQEVLQRLQLPLMDREGEIHALTGDFVALRDLAGEVLPRSKGL